MQQVFRIPAGTGYVAGAGPSNAGLKHLAVDVLRLQAGESWSGSSGSEEIVLVTLSGRCTVRIEGPHAIEWTGVGGRANVFVGLPAAVYVPRCTGYGVIADTAIELALFRAPCKADLTPVLVRPQEVTVASVGAANWRRDVRLIFGPGAGKTSRLIVGETLNPPGNWSGFPPHKHDQHKSDEFPLEEVYLFKALPSDGYGVQLIYGGTEGDTAHLVGDNDAAVFRAGYHPTVSSPGVQLCYTWALAGDDRVYQVYVDPRYRWLTAAEAILREGSKYWDAR